MQPDMCADDVRKAAMSRETPGLFIPKYTTDIVARPTQNPVSQKPVDIWAMDKHTREKYIAEHWEMFF